MTAAPPPPPVDPPPVDPLTALAAAVGREHGTGTLPEAVRDVWEAAGREPFRPFLIGTGGGPVRVERAGDVTYEGGRFLLDDGVGGTRAVPAGEVNWVGGPAGAGEAVPGELPAGWRLAVRLSAAAVVPLWVMWPAAAGLSAVATAMDDAGFAEWLYVPVFFTAYGLGPAAGLAFLPLPRGLLWRVPVAAAYGAVTSAVCGAWLLGLQHLGLFPE